MKFRLVRCVKMPIHFIIGCLNFYCLMICINVGEHVALSSSKSNKDHVYVNYYDNIITGMLNSNAHIAAHFGNLYCG